jgi:hypothetical protein
MFEYNLIPSPPTLKNRVGSIFAKSAEKTQTCERRQDTNIINQQ